MGRQTDAPRERFNRAKRKLDEESEIGLVPDSDYEAITEFIAAKNPRKVSVADPTGDSGKSDNTLANYCRTLKTASKRSVEYHDRPLTELDADAVNSLMSAYMEGTHPDVKDDGLTKDSVSKIQGIMRKFYEYYDFGPEKEEIPIVTPEPGSSRVDERDMFTREEIEAMRDEIPNPRDRCLFELLLNTGQRIRAIQTLRVKDVEPSEGPTGVYYLNTDADGLKRAHQNGQKRPLLGAKRAVYDWLQYHPCAEDPDAALITPLTNRGRSEPGEPLSQAHMGRRLKMIAEDAGVDKPVNHHNFRHNFVTIAKRDYDLNNDTIKHLIGHSPESNIMETTYSHLTDDDYIERAEIGAGFRKLDEESPLTPKTCPTCNDYLDPDVKACPGCGTVFAPDAQVVQEQIDQDLWESKSDAAREQEEALDQLKILLDENPRLVEALTEVGNIPETSR